ncbi:MAG: hypothetical protein HYT31_03660 [Parcubacteria group bacterium]|nr:hypothetical protein [Parcubacteria group bacterium]
MFTRFAVLAVAALAAITGCAGPRTLAPSHVATDDGDFNHPLIEEMQGVGAGIAPSHKELARITELAREAEASLKQDPTTIVTSHTKTARFSTGAIATFAWDLDTGGDAELTGRMLISSNTDTANDERDSVFTSVQIKEMRTTLLDGSGRSSRTVIISVWASRIGCEPRESKQELAKLLKGFVGYSSSYVDMAEANIHTIASWLRDGMPAAENVSVRFTEENELRQAVTRVARNWHTSVRRDSVFYRVVNELSRDGTRLVLPSHVSELSHDLEELNVISVAEEQWGADAWRKLIKYHDEQAFAAEKERLLALVERLKG